jgi:carbon storage regulator CsrA
MLVLTRKLQETIKIGDHVTIHVLRVKGNTVRLGIDAPRQIRVVRGELADKQAAAGEQVTAKMTVDPDVTRADAEDATGEDDSQCRRPALADYFPRVLKTVHFPLNTLDTNQDPIGS